MPRVGWALFWASIGIVLVALLRPVPPGELLPENVFWAKKAAAGPAEVVMAGDSRTYRSLAPAVMVEALPGRRILNYGWDSSGFAPDYLAAIDRHLAGNDATVILGLTPWSLTARSDTQTNFDEYQRKSALDLSVTLTFGTALSRFNSFIAFRPEMTAKGKAKADKWGKATKVQYFHADGWVYSDLVPHDPENSLASYAKNFADNPVSPAMVDGLLQRIRDWRARGVRVYAFRPPTTTAMIALEHRLSGYDETALARQVIAAGGTWVDVPQHDVYDCYDGSHITGDAAEQLSRAMATAIAGDTGTAGRITLKP